MLNYNDLFNLPVSDFLFVSSDVNQFFKDLCDISAILDNKVLIYIHQFERIETMSMEYDSTKYLV